MIVNGLLSHQIRLVFILNPHLDFVRFSTLAEMDIISNRLEEPLNLDLREQDAVLIFLRKALFASAVNGKLLFRLTAIL